MGAWLDGKLTGEGLKPASGVKLPYDMPPTLFARAAEEVPHYAALALWFAAAAEALEDLRKKYRRFKPVPAFFTLRGGSGPKADREVTGAPSLKVDKEKVDLGDMKFNQVAEVSFRLTNVGDQTLRFSKDPYIRGCGGVLTAYPGHRFDGPQTWAKHHLIDEVYDACRDGRQTRFPGAPAE